MDYPKIHDALMNGDCTDTALAARPTEEPHRRQALRAGLQLGVWALTTGTFVSGVNAKAVNAVAKIGKSITVKDTTTHILAEALRATENERCLQTAADLERISLDNSQFDLHLRNAGLKPTDAQLIAQALLKTGSGPALTSFSVSYNQLIGDDAVATLARALPPSVREIGFVGCAIGDIGGQALVEWAEQAPALRMMCVEDNQFSSKLEQRLANLAQSKTQLSVYL